MTTITSRVSAAPSADNTSRVAAQGANAAIPATLGSDTWRGTWGLTWGFTWYGTNAGTAAVDASPAVSTTSRVGSLQATSTTKRVTL